eukprot:scaffold11644_cov124-Skeletonema_marinoi.AAC.3
MTSDTYDNGQLLISSTKKIHDSRCCQWSESAHRNHAWCMAKHVDLQNKSFFQCPQETKFNEKKFHLYAGAKCARRAHL